MRKAIECNYIYVEEFEDTLIESVEHKLINKFCYQGSVGSSKYYDQLNRGMELISNINIPYHYLELNNVTHTFVISNYDLVDLTYIEIKGKKYKISRSSKTMNDFLNCDLIEVK